MNGRIYDPLLGRFLSADTEVQFAGDLQSYNRYSYVQNNPLRFVDPSGFLLESASNDLVQSTDFMVQGFQQSPPQTKLIFGLGVAITGTATVSVISIKDGIEAYDAWQKSREIEREANENIEEMKRRGTAPTAPQPTQPSPAEDHLNSNSVQNSQGDTVKTTQAPSQEANPDAPKQGTDSADSKKASDSKDSKSAASDAASGAPKLVDNPKHNPNSSSPQPSNAKDLYANSVVDKNGVRWAMDSDGTIHRFSKASNGESHWNGSTAGDKPIKEQNIPNDIKKQLDDAQKKKDGT
jgi:hypothetical protein